MNPNTALRKNQKTTLSFDTNSDCQRGCLYCYVQNNKYNPVRRVNQYEYNHELLRLGKKNLAVLRKTGLRLFSFADYRGTKTDKDMVLDVLQDCEEIGIKAKAITKSLKFIQHFEGHPAISVIHLSIDNLMAGQRLRVYMKRRNPPKVLIRGVVLNKSDIPFYLDLGVDIFTFNHANIKGYKNYFAAHFKDERETLIDQYDIRDKTCGLYDRCFDCEVQCGVSHG